MTQPKHLPATPVDDIRARNKAIVFAALAEAGIHKVTVEYDGGGDSGQIEDVAAWNAADEKIPFPSDRKIQLLSENPGSSPRPSRTLEDSGRTLSPGTISKSIPAGKTTTALSAPSSSTFPARTITLEHNERYTEVNTTSHEF